MKTSKMRVAFVGCGYTPITRRLERPETELAIEAALMAAADAGLDPAEIDGINIQVHHYPPPDTATIVRGIGMRQVAWEQDGGRGIPSAAVAAQAIESGACRAVLVLKIMNTIAPISTPQIDPDSGGVRGAAQFEVPYGLGYTMQRTALYARRYMHRYGITPEQLAWIPVVQREHALLNPWAIMKTPLTMEDYLASRFISEPLRLFDCDMPVNGAFAFLMTREDVAKTLRHRPVYLESWVGEHLSTPDHLLPERIDGPWPLAAELFEDARITPDDLGAWYLYDGFTHFVPIWMEDLGLLPRGEAGTYVDGGDTIRLGGARPLNTNGGQLSEGRLHGTGHVLEAIQQLRGTAGARQIPDLHRAIVATGQLGTGAVGILGVDYRR